MNQRCLAGRRTLHAVNRFQSAAKKVILMAVKPKYGAALFLFFLTIAANAQIQYAVIPENPRLGEPVTIGIAVDSGSGGPLRAALVSGGQRLAKAAFFSLDSGDGQPPVLAAVLAIPSTAAPGRAVINVESAGGIIGQIDLDIAGREFVSEVIELNPSLTGIRTVPDPQKTAESEQLWAILNRTGNEIFCFDTFCFPVASQRRTSFFGDRRVFKYSNGGSDTSVHAGVDYGVPKGTPVSACGPGRVVLARFRIVTGNSVIIEHLPGVYSLYYHLDLINTAGVERVNRTCHRTASALGNPCFRGKYRSGCLCRAARP